MEEQLAAFLVFLDQQRNYSENTIAAYRNDLGQLLEWIRAAQPVRGSWPAVGPDDLDRYVASLKSKSYTASSVARKVAAIKSFFHYLLARGLITSDPTTTIESPKVKKRLPRTLSADEVERLLAAPRAGESPKYYRDAALLQLLYATGMRVSEAVTLKVGDVGWKDSTVTVPGREEDHRDLPIDAVTREILITYIENGRPHLLRNRDEDALFLNHRGEQLTRQGLWLIIKDYADRAGLGELVTPHTLRHSFAAHKLDAGAELREVQQLLGHANISTTQVYSQLFDGPAGEKDA
jgi:integrase/recombinase XerD